MAAEGTGAVSLLGLEGNGECADCSARLSVAGSPWASINLGILLCVKCAGVHRSLGVDVSKVKSVTMDEWTPALLDEFRSKSNAMVNEELEYNVPEGTVKPSAFTPAARREAYIRSKYVSRAFVRRPGAEVRRPPAVDPSRDRSESEIEAGRPGMVQTAGIVMLKIVSASNLPAADLNGSSDPYVVVSTSRGMKQKTKVIRANLDPVWNENMSFSVVSLAEPLVFEVWDWDAASGDDLLGRGQFELGTLASKPGEAVKFVVPLLDTHGVAVRPSKSLTFATLSAEATYHPLG